MEGWKIVVKLQCLKQIQRKCAMVRKIGRFEKSRVRKIGIPLYLVVLSCGAVYYAVQSGSKF